MCLIGASDRILETPVTWVQFESHLKEALGTDARLGDNKAVIDIGEGIGFASRCGLITCDWVGAAEGETLPKRVVLKIPSSLPFRKLTASLPAAQRVSDGDDEYWAAMEGNLRNLHHTEVASYDFFEEFEGLSVPRCFYAKRFEDQIGGQICLEYMENSRMMNFHERHTVGEMKQVARALGKLHACSFKKEPSAPDVINAAFFSHFYTSRTAAYAKMFLGVLAVDSSEKTKQLMASIDAILPDYADTNLPITIHRQMGIRPVLVNGDLRTGNVLLNAESGDLAALIDWQCTHLGVGVEDLHRLALFALSSADRRASMPMLVEEMYNSMVADLDGVEPPYSLDTLMLLSDLLFPHCALFFAGACIALIQAQQKNPRLSDEEKLSRKEIVLDKVLGALVDVLDIHDDNKNRNGNIKFKFE